MSNTDLTPFLSWAPGEAVEDLGVVVTGMEGVSLSLGGQVVEM